MATWSSTPRDDGFRMPAEWEPHAGCWMLWPERPDTWRDNAVPAQMAFARVAEAIARFEPVTVGVSPSHLDSARQLLPTSIRVVTIPHDDAWLRDCGPTFVVNAAGEVRGVDWGFNAWGGLYSDWRQDEQVAATILDMTATDRYRADFVLEGGSIHVDGQGTLLTTTECLLNPNRNPHLSQAQLEERLMAYCNVQKVIWLGPGVYQDETSGHVDNLCCFVRPSVVVVTWTDDPFDPQYPISLAAYEQLCNATDAQGRRLEVHKLHQPGPLTLTAAESAGIRPAAGTLPRLAGTRLAASYVNFYIANGGVLVPTFDDPYDAAALATLQALFPEREVVGVSGREILLGGGNIHCITQQQHGG
ncbi:MAG: agmatine deiminase [Anaerolineales bacterium]|nr:agmatine deiminase [Anaerolineales bacterium]